MARANRIVGHGTKPADQFTHNPNNPRVHPQKQRDAVAGSLDTLGWVAPVIENVRTGYLLDGHERIWHALQTGEDVPYVQVDLSEAEEAQFLATFDWITYLAEYDRDALETVMQGIESDNAHIQALVADMADNYGLINPDIMSPDDFAEYGEDIQTEYCCPKCGYRWSGNPKPGEVDDE